MDKKITTYFFISMFVFILGMNLYLFYPLLHTFAFAAIIAGTFVPVLNMFLLKYKMKKKWAALLTTFCVVLTVLLPSTYIVFQVSKETINLYQGITRDLEGESLVEHISNNAEISAYIDRFVEKLPVEMTKEDLYQQLINKAQGYTGGLVKMLNAFLGDTFYFLFQFVMMIVAIYALFLSGDNLKDYVFKLSPLPDELEQRILDRFVQMNYVTMIGNGVGGIIQGGLAGIAFWMAGLPSVFLWTSLMIILAFIPIVGISVISIPATLYLIMKGKVTVGVLLFVWCTIVSLLVENIFKPKFVGDRLKVNNIVLLFYITAGMSVFGAAGIFYGPILCIIFLTISEMFIQFYTKQETL